MTKWDEIIREFQDLSPEERLEELIEQAERLPPLSPDRVAAPLPESCRVQECQTPVYLWIDVIDGRVHLEAEVPRKSPTVRGLVTVIIEALEGSTPAEVLTLPVDVLGELGLTEALGMTRQQGVRGVIMRIKHAVLAATGAT